MPAVTCVLLLDDIAKPTTSTAKVWIAAAASLTAPVTLLNLDDIVCRATMSNRYVTLSSCAVCSATLTTNMFTALHLHHDNLRPVVARQCHHTHVTHCQSQRFGHRAHQNCASTAARSVTASVRVGALCRSRTRRLVTVVASCQEPTSTKTIPVPSARNPP